MTKIELAGSTQTIPRPTRHLRALEARYPLAWRQAAHFREGRGVDLPHWPDWCYLPLSAAYAIVSGGSDEPLTPLQGLDISADRGARRVARDARDLPIRRDTPSRAVGDTR